MPSPRNRFAPRLPAAVDTISKCCGCDGGGGGVGNYYSYCGCHSGPRGHFISSHTGRPSSVSLPWYALLMTHARNRSAPRPPVAVVVEVECLWLCYDHRGGYGIDSILAEVVSKIPTAMHGPFISSHISLASCISLPS